MRKNRPFLQKICSRGVMDNAFGVVTLSGSLLHISVQVRPPRDSTMA